MTTAIAQRAPNQVAYQSQPVGSGELPGTVRGLALPFNDRNGQGGMLIDEEGLHFYEYTLYRTGAFDGQLAEPNFGGRVRFMWNHGGYEGGLGWATGSGPGVIPIGNVTSLTALPTGVMFEAEFNETDLAGQVAQAVQEKSVQEVSVLVENQVASVKTDDAGRDFLDVTQARLWDVSLVTRGHYPNTRIFSANCQDCGSKVVVEPDPNDARGRSLRASSTVVTNPPKNDPCGEGDVVAMTRKQVGALYAHINDLRNRLRVNGLCPDCSPDGEPCVDHVKL